MHAISKRTICIALYNAHLKRSDICAWGSHSFTCHAPVMVKVGSIKMWRSSVTRDDTPKIPVILYMSFFPENSDDLF